MKILKTSRFHYEVIVNEDGTLRILYAGDKSNVPNAGALINGMGGIQKVLERCEEYTQEEYEKEMLEYREKVKADRAAARVRAREKEEERAKSHDEEYKALLSKGEVIESTPENIGIVLRHLSDCNLGAWTLPRMTIGYSCNQYDCDGKQATTMKLDRPINVNGEMVNKFKVGAPVGHLLQYHRV